MTEVRALATTALEQTQYYAIIVWNALKDLTQKVIHAVSTFFDTLDTYLFSKLDIDYSFYNPFELAETSCIEPLQKALRTSCGRPRSISIELRGADFEDLCKDYPIGYKITNSYGQLIKEGTVNQAQEVNAILLEEKQRTGGDLHSKIHFPEERSRIARWASEWASKKIVQADPNHPFYEIVEAAFARKNNLGGRYDSEDISSYQQESNGSRNQFSRFRYLIYSIIGFQELSKHEELFHYLDNLSLVNGENPAYTFASEISRIYTYPKALGTSTDIRHKLQNGLGAAQHAWEIAKELNCIDDFFEKCFTNAYCFDARVMKFQEFSMEKEHARFEDFHAKVNHRDTVEVKITRYLEAFRNLQIKKYAEEHPEAGNYQSFKAQVIQGNENEHINRFETNYYTRDEFANYLAAENEPVRKAEVAGDDLPKVSNNLYFNENEPFLIVREKWKIPQGLREAGATFAIRRRWNLGWNSNWYKASVSRVEENWIQLDLRGDPIPRGEWEGILDTYGLL